MPEIEHDGIRISFEDHGQGPPIVLGHSFLCSGEMWEPQVAPLAERYRVVNIDHRGHGKSGPADRPFEIYDMVGDVVAVLDELAIDRAVWCGLSIGGMVAMRAALTVPDRVRGLILMDTHAGRETGYKKLKYRVMNLCARSFGLRPLLRVVLPLMFGATTRKTKPELVARWGDRFVAVDLPSISATLGALVRRDDVHQRLAGVEVPAMVIVGEEDVALPPGYSQRLSAAFPNASLMVIPEAGHLSALEQPEAVTEAIERFLSALP